MFAMRVASGVVMRGLGLAAMPQNSSESIQVYEKQVGIEGSGTNERRYPGIHVQAGRKASFKAFDGFFSTGERVEKSFHGDDYIIVDGQASDRLKSLFKSPSCAEVLFNCSTEARGFIKDDRVHAVYELGGELFYVVYEKVISGYEQIPDKLSDSEDYLTPNSYDLIEFIPPSAFV